MKSYVYHKQAKGILKLSYTYYYSIILYILYITIKYSIVYLYSIYAYYKIFNG